MDDAELNAMPDEDLQRIAASGKMANASGDDASKALPRLRASYLKLLTTKLPDGGSKMLSQIDACKAKLLLLGRGSKGWLARVRSRRPRPRLFKASWNSRLLLLPAHCAVDPGAAQQRRRPRWRAQPAAWAQRRAPGRHRRPAVPAGCLWQRPGLSAAQR
jgi:hypothetical protein